MTDESDELYRRTANRKQDFSFKRCKQKSDFLEGLTTSIAVISGKNAPETFEKAEEYCNVLPSIEHIEISGCGLLPHRENADAFLEQIDILLSDNC